MVEEASVGVVEKATPSIPPYDLDTKLDACLDLSIRRLLYSSLAGASAAVLFFRSRTTRWAAVAFGAGAGVGSAYTECSYILDGHLPKWPSYKDLLLLLMVLEVLIQSEVKCLQGGGLCRFDWSRSYGFTFFSFFLIIEYVMC